jgi:hypothetical protein
MERRWLTDLYVGVARPVVMTIYAIVKNPQHQFVALVLRAREEG